MSESGGKVIDWLDKKEIVIRSLFRLAVILSLVVALVRIEDAISTAEATYSEASDAKDYADTAADNSKEAASDAAEARDACSSIIFRR